MSINASFNIAQKALALNQAGLGVVSNNIANMNTPGYSKQRLDQETSGYMNIMTGDNQSYTISAGAQISSIVRYRQEYLDTAYREQNSDTSFYYQLQQMATSIESSLNELGDTGLLDALSQFYDSVNTLNTNPADSTARTNFVQKAQILCTQFNQTAQNIKETQIRAVGDLSDPNTLYTSTVYAEVETINSKLEQLATINKTIVDSSTLGNIPNDLMDKRDLILDEISQYMPITTSTNSNGGINLYVNGLKLVEGTKVNKLDIIQTTDPDYPLQIQYKDSNGDLISSNINSKFDTGELAAYLQMAQNETGKLSFPSILNQLDKLANSVATTINDIQTYSNGNVKAMAIDFDADGKKFLSDYSTPPNTGLPTIFSAKDSSSTISALNITVDPEISANYWKIAAARVDTTDPDWNQAAVGNADNSQLFAKTRVNPIDSLASMNPENYLTNIVTDMAAKIETIEFNYDTESTAFKALQTQRQSQTGVNLDEELVDLVKYQRAYEASARVFSVTAEILKTLVNLGT